MTAAACDRRSQEQGKSVRHVAHSRVSPGASAARDADADSDATLCVSPTDLAAIRFACRQISPGNREISSVEEKRKKKRALDNCACVKEREKEGRK